MSDKKNINKSVAVKEILERITKGESLRSILPFKERPEHLPVISTFMLWVSKDKKLSEQYARAMSVRADLIFEEILEIADDSSEDTITVDKRNDKGEITSSYDIENKEWVNRSKLRVDARKWMLGKMAPKKYGDKVDVTTNGKDLPGQNVTIVVNGKPLHEPVTDEADIKED